MCPACLASAAVMTGGVVSMGGITTLVVKLLGSKRSNGGDASNSAIERGKDDGHNDKQETGNGRAEG